MADAAPANKIDAIAASGSDAGCDDTGTARPLPRVPAPSPPEPSALVGERAPEGFSPPERPHFRSWVEDYARSTRDWRFDRVALKGRQVQGLLRAREQYSGTNPYSRTVANNLAVERAAAHKRFTDPFERAKSFLQRRVPVYSAALAGGETDQFVVGNKMISREALIELARARGWQG